MSCIRFYARRVPFALVGALLAGVAAGAQGPVNGDQVGALSLQANGLSEYLLHGTIPVPEGITVDVAGEELVPLKVRDSDGTLLDDTQVEVVSRFPSGDPAVVELLARVQGDPGWAPGQLVSYEVVYDENVTAPPTLMPDRTALKEGPEGVTPLFDAWLSYGASVVVVIEDMAGNQYGFAPLLSGGELFRTGSQKTELVTYGVAQHFAGNLEPYPHGFGVHAYVSTEADEDFVRMDLRISNGGDGLDPIQETTDDDPLGDVYFKKIEVWVRENVFDYYEDGVFDNDKRRWFQPQVMDPTSFQGDEATEVTDLPWVGLNRYRVFPLIKENADGKAHYMPCRGQLVRRTMISRYEDKDEALAVLREAGLGFATAGGTPAAPWYSFEDGDSAGYMATHATLPDLDFVASGHAGESGLRQVLATQRALQEGAVASGASIGGLHKGSTGALGYAHPFGVPYGGATGGNEITAIPGHRLAACASRDGYLMTALWMRRVIDRMPIALYSLSGAPTSFEAFLVDAPNCSYCPDGPNGPAYDGERYNADAFTNPNEANKEFCTPGSTWAQNAYVEQNNLVPGYANQLLGYDQYDLQHWIRAYKDALTLVWIGNEGLARDELEFYAEQFRAHYTDFPTTGSSNPLSDNFTDHSLRHDRNFVNAHPGSGTNAGRGEAHGIFAIASFYAIADDAWRQRMAPYLAEVADVMIDSLANASDPAFTGGTAPIPFGFIYAHLAPSLCLDDPINDPEDDRGRKPWEQMLLDNALLALRNSVFVEAPAPSVHADLTELLTKTFYGHCAPASWNEAGGHVRVKLEASPYANPKPPVNAVPLPLLIYQTEADLPGECFATTGLTDGIQYSWTAFGHAYTLTGDALFLDYAADTGNVNCGGSCETPLVNFLQSKNPSSTSSANWWVWDGQAVLLGALQ